MAMPRKASRLRAQLSSIGIAIRSFEPEMLWGWIAHPTCLKNQTVNSVCLNCAANTLVAIGEPMFF